MEVKELNEALENLKKELSGKSEKEIKASIEAFEVSQKAVLDTLETKIREEYQAEIKKLEDYASKLDIKIQAGARQDQGPKDDIKELIRENFDGIKAVRKGHSFNIETKVVGDMTLGTNLTGDEPRDYSNTVAMVPNQLINVSDLMGSIQISGGTYTFPRETTSEGAIDTPTEGLAKSQIDYDLSMIDVNTDFIAGYCTYSKKMANNLPFLESFLPQALRRDYWKAENANFEAVIAAGVTASTELAASHATFMEQIIAEMATLEALDFAANGVVMTPADYWAIMVSEKSTGAGYGLPGVVTMQGGQLRVNGVPIYRATWMPADKYIVADWSTFKKVNTEGMSVQFSTEDGDNFKSNNITGRVEAQTALAIHRPDAAIYGDFTAV